MSRDDLRKRLARRLYNAAEGHFGGESWDEMCRRWPGADEQWLRVADAALDEFLELASTVTEAARPR